MSEVTGIALTGAGREVLKLLEALEEIRRITEYHPKTPPLEQIGRIAAAVLPKEAA